MANIQASRSMRSAVSASLFASGALLHRHFVLGFGLERVPVQLVVGATDLWIITIIALLPDLVEGVEDLIFRPSILVRQMQQRVTKSVNSSAPGGNTTSSAWSQSCPRFGGTSGSDQGSSHYANLSDGQKKTADAILLPLIATL